MTASPQPTQMPSVSVIFVSYNRLADLRVALTSLARHVTEPSVEVIVVDNASQDPVVPMLSTDFPWVRLVAHQENRGYGPGCNAGAAVARGAFLLFVNSDIIFQGNPLPAMVEVLRNEQTVGAVGVTLLNRDGSPQPSGFRFPSLWLRSLQLFGIKSLLLWLSRGRIRSGHHAAPAFITGAFVMVPRELFQAVGGFDERYFMYLEDADLGYRIHRAGRAARLLTTSDVIHLGEHYEETSRPFVFQQMNIGQILFYRSHYGRLRSIALALMSLLAFGLRWIVAGSHDTRTLYRDVVRRYAEALARAVRSQEVSA